MDIPKDQFQISTFVTKNHFSNVINLMYGKIHIHHAHVTDEIIRFAHNFCNLKIRENKEFFFLSLHAIFSALISFLL